ncbi:hypothetical protein P4639_22695 [Priestia megaterium]|uniref:hypothetical protein n=1 Tax=Priestia megaterium TaxID=1404 RepID=UPI002E1C7789|nr:hypothetical protein [Priestia megaterium]
MNLRNHLIDNFGFVQRKIVQIQNQENIDIKQISDLQRYTEMQERIIKSLNLMNSGGVK